MYVMLTNDWDGPAETPDSSHFPASVLVLPLPFTWSRIGLDVAPPSSIVTSTQRQELRDSDSAD